jgi:hypothetical protein
MNMTSLRLLFTTLLVSAAADNRHATAQPQLLVIGQTFAIESRAVGETRRINVYLPPGYGETAEKRFPVLYMPVRTHGADAGGEGAVSDDGRKRDRWFQGKSTWPLLIS